MRVATRRVRAAWRVFGNAYERTVCAINSTAQDPGERARGCSRPGCPAGVAGRRTIARLEARSGRIDALVEAWTAERAVNHGLSDRPFGVALVHRIRARARATRHDAGRCDQAVAPHAPSTVRTRAPSVIWESYQAVRSFEDIVADADVSTLHDLRIATKWLRYTLEFVREPMEPRAAELIRRVVVLQDHLGDIHDLHATAARARGSLERPDLPAGERAAIDWLLANGMCGSSACSDDRGRPGGALPTPTSGAGWDGRWPGSDRGDPCTDVHQIRVMVAHVALVEWLCVEERWHPRDGRADRRRDDAWQGHHSRFPACRANRSQSCSGCSRAPIPSN